MKTKRKMIFYEVNPRFFKDENGDGVGDLLGIISKYDYFYHLGVEAIILQDIASKEEQKNRTPFCGIEPVVGTKEELGIITNLAKNYHQKIIVEIDLGFLYKKYYWFKDHSKYSKTNSKTIEGNNEETRETTKLSSLKSFLPSKELIKKWKNELVIKNLLKILRFWHQLGISGFVFENFEHLTDETELEVVSNQTLFELRKIYHLTKEINNNFIIIGRSKKVSFEDGEKYANINSKVFDYFMSLKISLLGISKKFKLDAPSDFSPRLYSMLLNETYLKCSDNIVAFNSKIIGKAISRWANDGEYLEESAKVLALLLFLNGASPLIYSGEEIGLPNIGLTKHSDFKSPNFEERKLIALRENLAEKDFYKAQIINSSLNAKGLMHWNDSKNGGFSTANKTISPLSKAIENVNVKIQYQENTSVLNFYRKLIQLVCNSSFSNLINNGNLKATKLSSSFIKYEIFNDDSKLFVIINFSNVSKINFFRNRNEKVIFSTYSNRDYQKIPRFFEPYEGIILAYSQPKYVKTTKQIEIEKIRKSKIEKKAREKAKLEATLKQKQALEAAKKAQEKMIDNKIKAAQAEEKEILFKRYKNKKFKDDLEHEKQMEAAKKQKQEVKAAPKKSFDPFATNDLELEELKKSTQIDWKADKSHLDEATKLKEEELAKTILLDDDVDLDKLFEDEKNQKK